MKCCGQIRKIIEKTWLRLVSSDARYSGDYAKFDRIYVVRNPWRMESSGEECRFRETNRVVLDRFGRVDTLLEIGCGEGHQSLYLRQTCNHLIGLDVSARAITRARRRCSNVDFLVGDLFNKEIAAEAPFGLVVACEVLYYMNDVAAALRQMYELGGGVIVTYFEGEMQNLDPVVLSMFDCGSEILQCEGGRWRAAWFRGKHHTARPDSLDILRAES